MREEHLPYLTPTAIIDSDHPSIQDYARKARGGLPVVYAADLKDDWTAPETWKKSNPNYGVTMAEDS